LKFRYWAWAALWAVLVLAAIVMAGLWRRMFFGYTPITAFVEDSRVANKLLLIASACSLGAGTMTRRERYPRWVALCVAAPPS
jgi:hypothetical protein